MNALDALVSLVEWWGTRLPGDAPLELTDDFVLEALPERQDRTSFLSRRRGRILGLRFLGSSAGATGASVFFEGVDEVTGLKHHFAWLSEFDTAGRLHRILALTSGGGPAAALPRVCEDEATALGLRRLSSEHRESYERAVRALEEVDPRARQVELDESEVLEAAGWWYIPFGWIGCFGHIVDKHTGQVTRLGSSPLRLAPYLWAFERGVLRAPCTLVIERIHDVRRATALLGQLDNRSPYNPVPLRADGQWLDVPELLESLPASIPSASLWYAVPALQQAEREHAFEFRVEA
jgi:hypothetical protein